MKNETKMQRSVKSRILAVIAMLLLGISILTSLVVFTDFMEHTIYEESTAHLTEIYHQANQTLYNKVSFNWGVMRSGRPIWKVRKAMPMSALSFHRQRENTILQTFSSFRGMAPMSHWMVNEAILIWVGRCRI